MLDLLERLNKVRPSGEGWTAACPGHDDKNPSLAVSRGDDGRWLLKCFAGCDLDRILGALELEAKDLYPEDGNAPSRQTVESVHDYDGAYEVVRYRNPKGFRQRRRKDDGTYEWNLKGVKPRLYRLKALRGQPVVLVVEGERDVDTLWDLGVPATCNSGGAGRWKEMHKAQLVEAGVARVHVIPDGDEAGRKHADQVARSCAAAGLVVKVLTLPDGVKDMSDWVAAGATRDDLYDLIRATDVYVPPEGEADDEAAASVIDVPVLTRLSDVTPETVNWLWERRFAKRKLSLVVGEPGECKSTLMADCGARVTRGERWPDGGHAPHGAVLLLSAEDGLADTVRPKFDACGGDATQVHVLTAVKTADGTERHFDLGRDMATLEAAIRQHTPVLVCIDPLSAYLGKVDSWRDSEVRGVLAPLATMAEQHGCAVVGILHLTKNQGSKVLNRVLGSIGFVAAARIVLAVTHDPDDETRHLLLPVKSNLAPPADVLAFSRVGDRIVWEGAPVEGVTVDGIMAESPVDRGERSDAEAFLRDILAGGPVPAKDVLRAAKTNGVSERTLKRAKSHLGVRSQRMGGLGTDGQWHWWLPTKTATSRITEDVAPLETQTQERPIATGGGVKGAKYGSVPCSGPVSDATKSANTAKRATNDATLNTAPLIERLNKTTKKTKSATSEVDGHPTSLLGGTRKPFVFDPTAAFEGERNLVGN